MITDILTANEAITPNSKEIKILHTHFPECFTSEGKFDMDKFETIIKQEVDITHEGYELNFLGKSYAKLLASLDTTTLIQPDTEHNSKPENANSQNVYISGDNLDGLKHLVKSYAGRVKCIYIDPPYNTGSDAFTYKDNFNFTAAELSTKLSISEEQAEKIIDLTKRGSASHSAWLMFMYPRLQLAKDLLSDNGVIFISIDDNEQANLKLLCDNVFGEEFFESNVVVVVNPGGRDYKQIAITNEYLLTYSRPSAELNEIPKESNFSLSDSQGGYNARELRNRNPKFHRGNRPNLFYPFFVNPNISENGYCAVGLEYSEEYCIEVKPYNSTGAESVWRWSKQKAKENIVSGDTDKSQILAKQKRDGGWNIYEKNRRSTTKIKSVWDETEMRTEDGTREIRSLFGKTCFDHPKPVELIKRCFMVGSNPGDLVVDFFSGSGTSAQAIMELNAESGEEQRTYIMIQLQESTKNGSEAKKGGFNTIDEIGIERIKLAAQKIRKKYNVDLDFGFKHYTLVEPSADTIDKLEVFKPNESNSPEMFAYDDMLTLFGKESVLQTWLVKDGYGFGANAEPVKLNRYTAYLFGKHLYFLDTELYEDDVVVLIDRYHKNPKFNPENLVLFGYSFTFNQTDLLRKNIPALKDSSKNLKPNIDIRY